VRWIHGQRIGIEPPKHRDQTFDRNSHLSSHEGAQGTQREFPCDLCALLWRNVIRINPDAVRTAHRTTPIDLLRGLRVSTVAGIGLDLCRVQERKPAPESSNSRRAAGSVTGCWQVKFSQTKAVARSPIGAISPDKAVVLPAKPALRHRRPPATPVAGGVAHARPRPAPGSHPPVVHLPAPPYVAVSLQAQAHTSSAAGPAAPFPTGCETPQRNASPIPIAHPSWAITPSIAASRRRFSRRHRTGAGSAPS
jgi:hypothetical protein